MRALRSAQICARTLDDVDLAAGTLRINDQPRRLDALTSDADVAMHVARSGLLDVQVLAKRLWRPLGEGTSAIAVLMSASAGCGRLLSPVAA